MFRPANRPRASSKLKSLICPRRSLSRSLSVSRANGAGGGDHLCAGIVRLGDDAVEPQFGQEWQEQEDPSVACVQPLTGAEVQEPPVRDERFFRPGQVFTSPLTGRSPSTIGDKKGGTLPRRNWA